MGAKDRFAVLCPFVEAEDGLSLLFEVRARGIRQGGEVCFPGGRAENGENPEACALRETEEELGIPSGEISLIGRSDFMCNPRGFLLQPVLGLLSPAGLRAVRPSPAEVSAVFTVPLSFLRGTPPEVWSWPLAPQVPDDFPYEDLGIPRDYPWAQGRTDIPVWRWQDRVIWGMTARIVRHLLLETEDL